MGQGMAIDICTKPSLHNKYQDRILMGAERKSQYIDQKAKLATAYHEVLYLLASVGYDR